MVCSNCALDLDPTATVCPRCGTTVVNNGPVMSNEQVVMADPGVNTSRVADNQVPQGVVDITQPVPVVNQTMAQQQMPVNNPGMTAQQNAVPQQMPVNNPGMPVGQAAPMTASVGQTVSPDVNQMVSNMRVDSVMPTATMGKLNIVRKKSFVGCIIPFTVFVDGTELGKLNNNTTLSFDLSFGQHQVILKSTGKGVEQVVDLSSNQVICDMQISPKFGLITAVPKVAGISYRNQ